MSTKTHQDTTNIYNAAAMKNYNAFQPQLLSSYLQMLNNPLGSSYFKNQLAQQKAQANQLGLQGTQNALQNLKTGGGVLSNGGGVAASLLTRTGIGNNLMQANAFNSALNTALSNRNYALGGMAAYQPLQTGQNSVSYKSGAGTWLGPVLGGAFNMLMPGIGGMLAGTGFKAGMSGAYGNAGAAGSMAAPTAPAFNPMQGQFGAPPTSWQNPFDAYNK